MKTNSKKFIVVMSTFVGALVFNIYLLGNTLVDFIDISIIIIMAGISYFAISKYKEQFSSVIIGGSILCLLAGLVGILANISDPNYLASAIALQLLVPLYSLIFIYFIYNIYLISKDNTTLQISMEYDISSNKKKIIEQLLFFIVFILLVVLSGAGFAAYIAVSSIVAVAVIGVVYIIEDKYKRLQVIKNYLIGYPMIIVLISVISVLKNYSDATIVGPAIEIALLSIIYLIYLYLAVFKAQLTLYKIDTKQIEMSLFSTGVIVFILLVAWIISIFYFKSNL